MHEYSVSYHDRKNVLYFLALFSILSSPLISHVLSKISSISSMNLAAPSGLAVFFLFFLIFDQFIWKWKLLYKLNIIKIPDLNGDWQGTILSSTGNKEIKIDVKIHQTYTKLTVRLEAPSSLSFSKMAIFDMADPTCFNLRYEYKAEYKPSKTETKIHYGVTNLLLKNYDGEVTRIDEARYYTELGRDTHGQIVLQKSNQ